MGGVVPGRIEIFLIITTSAKVTWRLRVYPAPSRPVACLRLFSCASVSLSLLLLLLPLFPLLLLLLLPVLLMLSYCFCPALRALE